MICPYTLKTTDIEQKDLNIRHDGVMNENPVHHVHVGLIAAGLAGNKLGLTKSFVLLYTSRFLQVIPMCHQYATHVLPTWRSAGNPRALCEDVVITAIEAC